MLNCRATYAFRPAARDDRGVSPIGLGLGLAFPQNPVVLAIAQSGTWFPRTIVTFATAIIFILMSAALARTLLTHTRGTRFLAILDHAVRR